MSESSQSNMRAIASGLNDAPSLNQPQIAQGKLQRQNEQLELLLNLTSEITSNLDLREVMRAISASIRGAMLGDYAGVVLLDQPSGKLRLLAYDSPGTSFKEGQMFRPSRAAKKALDTLKPVIVDWREDDEPVSEAHALAIGAGFKARCVIPLVNRGRSLGIISISRSAEGSFSPEAVAFLSRASGQIAIAVANALTYQELSKLKDKLAQEKVYLQEEIRSELGFEEIIGNSAALKHALQLVETVAPSDSTVLLLGETGTGKELIARAIHERSRRKGRTFVKLNCAAIPTGLLESELFGHEKGAFTGAITQKIGRMELANQGTLFLDEIGDISIELQPKLLRVLQEREFERLGSNRTVKVDTRLIAATHRDISGMVRKEEFREDLFYRLNVFPIHIPPLRERQEDIPLLVHYFVSSLSRKMVRSIRIIPANVMDALASFSWPGNVRQLQNFIERSLILSSGETLAAPISELNYETVPEGVSTNTLHAMEREAILNVLRAARGTLSGPGGAAERLGLVIGSQKAPHS